MQISEQTLKDLEFNAVQKEIAEFAYTEKVEAFIFNLNLTKITNFGARFTNDKRIFNKFRDGKSFSVFRILYFR